MCIRDRWNTVLGWIIFVIAFFTYLSTIEPNFSFWDCGEYISSAVKLEVTHAPGAALFQLVGAVAAIFALGNGENYSVVINAMSVSYTHLDVYKRQDPGFPLTGQKYLSLF